MTRMRPWKWIGTEHWPAPASIRALQTLRQPPGRDVPEDSVAAFNLGLQGEDEALVHARRRCLVSEAGLPSSPVWLHQVHGTTVLDADRPPAATDLQADAILSRQAGRVCVVMTADCLPLLLARRDGTGVAAVHAGWRGLAAGVIENACQALGGPLLAWLGPCIGQQAFEVGPEVRAAFVESDGQASVCFHPGQGDRWWADLHGLARQRLAALGVDVFGAPDCTFNQPDRYYSYRRDPHGGRQASLIWLE